MPKILAIDDDLTFLEVITDLLEYKEFQVIAALTSRLALQLAESQRPDLIICDIKMPGLDGYEVLKWLRQNSATQNIPVIILTGDEPDSVYRRARELGANDCLDKLCSLEELIQAIEAQLKE